MAPFCKGNDVTERKKVKITEIYLSAQAVKGVTGSHKLVTKNKVREKFRGS